MRKRLRRMARRLGHLSPSIYYFIQYKRALRKVGNKAKEREENFELFLESCAGKQCLQIGVKDSIGKKFGPNWVSADKYDTREFIDFQYDIHDLGFEDELFDGVACISILEHVPEPQTAIAEMHRVLKPGGKIWVQLPFLFPYHEAPKDYWRVTPDGLRVWMKQFDEISCGMYCWVRTPLITSTYFWGEKKAL